jgi:hypothetical protein
MPGVGRSLQCPAPSTSVYQGGGLGIPLSASTVGGLPGAPVGARNRARMIAKRHAILEDPLCLLQGGYTSEQRRALLVTWVDATSAAAAIARGASGFFAAQIPMPGEAALTLDQLIACPAIA